MRNRRPLWWRLHLWVVLTILMADSGMSLHGSDVRCRGREGETVEVKGITTSNPCYTCRCVRGIVQCEDARRRCPILVGCYVLADKQPGECCQRCAACRVNGTSVIESGSTWRDATNPCLTHSCHSGVITSQKAECEAPTACANPGWANAAPPVRFVRIKASGCVRARQCATGRTPAVSVSAATVSSPVKNGSAPCWPVRCSCRAAYPASVVRNARGVVPRSTAQRRRKSAFFKTK